MTSREIIRELLAKRLPERMGLNENFWGKLPDSPINSIVYQRDSLWN